MRIQHSHPSSSAHTWQPRKIWRIARAVKDAKTVNLTCFLNALLARQLLYSRSKTTCNSTYPEEISQSKRLLDLMLREAEDFCADESSQRSLDMRRHIRQWYVREIVTIPAVLNNYHSAFRKRERRSA